VTAVSASNPGNNKSVTADCPTPTVLLSGGYSISDPHVVVLDSRPNGSADGWLVDATELGLPGGTAWDITAYVVCATP
jgi:hypothetical protein